MMINREVWECPIDKAILNRARPVPMESYTKHKGSWQLRSNETSPVWWRNEKHKHRQTQRILWVTSSPFFWVIHTLKKRGLPNAGNSDSVITGAPYWCRHRHVLPTWRWSGFWKWHTKSEIPKPLMTSETGSGSMARFFGWAHGNLGLHWLKMAHPKKWPTTILLRTQQHFSDNNMTRQKKTVGGCHRLLLDIGMGAARVNPQCSTVKPWEPIKMDLQSLV